MAEPAGGRRAVLRLARLSFVHPERAADLLTAPELSWWDAQANAPTSDAAAAVVAALGRTADPDAALSALSAIVAGAPELRAALEASSELRARLLGLLGVSTAL